MAANQKVAYPNFIMSVHFSYIFSEFNSFSKSFDGVCAASDFCQYGMDLESGKKSSWVASDRWFHKRCVFFRLRKLARSWCCGCSTPDEEISIR